MKQQSGMSTKEIVQAARVFARFNDRLREAVDDTDMAEHQFMTDLLKVGLLVADADGAVSKREQFALTCITSMIKFAEYAELLRWDHMDDSDRRIHEDNFTNYHDLARAEGLEDLESFTALWEAEMHVTNRSTLIAKLADALYGFADLVARADGALKPEEVAQLERVRTLLERQRRRESSQGKEAASFATDTRVGERQTRRYGGEDEAHSSEFSGNLTDSRNLAIGTLVALLGRLSETALHELIDLARELAKPDE